MDDKLLRRLRGWHSDGSFNIDELCAWLAKQGVDMLGSGAFGVVIDCDLFVVKLLDADDDGYLQWIKFCEQFGPNRYMPRIFYSGRISQYLHCVVLEKLETASDRDIAISGDMEYRAIRSWEHNWAGPKARWARNHINEELKALLALMAEYRNGYNREIEKHNEESNDWYKNELCRDIHTGNIMFRQQQLVISDPWCV